MENDYVEIFKRQLDMKQVELGLNNIEFSNYIGMGRSWLPSLRNPNLPDYPLSRPTMGKLYNRLNIDYDLMVAYNKQIKESRK